MYKFQKFNLNLHRKSLIKLTEIANDSIHQFNQEIHTRIGVIFPRVSLLNNAISSIRFCVLIKKSSSALL